MESDLEAFGSIDGAKRTEDSEDSKDFDDRNGAGTESEGNERHADDEQVEKVESGSAEGSLVEDHSVGDDFQSDLDGEDGREKVVEMIQDLSMNISIVFYIPSENKSKKVLRDCDPYQR